jgi:hypothetical protein
MNYKKVDKQRAKEIQDSLGDLIEFKYIDNTLKGMTLYLEDGPVTMEISNYSDLVLLEQSKTEKFKLTWQATVADEKVLMEKLFDDDYTRESYIREHLFDTPEDELSLTKVLVNDNCGCEEPEDDIPF